MHKLAQCVEIWLATTTEDSFDAAIQEVSVALTETIEDALSFTRGIFDLPFVYRVEYVGGWPLNVSGLVCFSATIVKPFAEVHLPGRYNAFQLPDELWTCKDPVSTLVSYADKTLEELYGDGS